MKFKVFVGTTALPRRTQFYFHVRSSNGKITLQSEGYPTVAHAHRAVAAVWKSFAKALHASLLVPIPYTRDSLKPAPKRT